jgi:hypothetical protein
MILNDRQYAKVSAIIKKHLSKADFLRRRIANPREAAAALLEAQVLETRAAQLSAQIDFYNKLLRNDRAEQPLNLIDVPQSLIARRISNRLSQDELARLLAINVRTLMRYEMTLYASASFGRVVQIDATLRQVEASRLAQCEHQSGN